MRVRIKTETGQIKTMDAETMKKIFVGLDEPTRNVLVQKLKPQLSKALYGLNENLRTTQTTLGKLCPPVSDILAAFRICPIGSARVVIIAQDPYIGAGEAHGLCFSVPRGVTIPPSLKNIIACLQHTGLMRSAPTSGDLTGWAKQGVLLLNSALTTRLSKSNAHAEIWAPYTDAIVSYLSDNTPRCIFMLFGGFARGKSHLIDAKRHLILEWGHPSPLNRDNQTAGAKHFSNCDAFVRANKDLASRGLPQIKWDLYVHPNEGVGAIDGFRIQNPQPAQLALNAQPTLNALNSGVNTSSGTITAVPDSIAVVTTMAKDLIIGAAPVVRGIVATDAIVEAVVCAASDNDPCPLTANTLWIFTDGASRANGRPNCTASWGFYITDGSSVIRACGMVEPVDIPGKLYRSSNNRGELSAVLFALQAAATHKASFFFSDVILVSDSEYAIGCIDTHLAIWESKLTVKEIDQKLNIDLIRAAHIARASLGVECKFRHVNSHKAAPVDIESEKWFIWRGNDIADKLCEVVFPRAVQDQI